MNRGLAAVQKYCAERGAQKRLAEKTGLSQGYLSRILSQERDPGLTARKKIRAAIGVSLDAWEDAIPNSNGDAA